MVATLNKSFKLGMVFVVLFSVLSMLFTPIEASAASASQGTRGGIPTISFDKDGNMVVEGDGFSDGKGTNAWSRLIEKYRAFIVGISGIGAITMVVIFIFQFLKLGGSAGNPQARTQALIGILWSGIAAAGLGAVTLIVGLFYNSIG
ncbi:hypothetical protein NDS46_30745 (plasmid) [Paenibacillus thiaminolyticus]|uniref:hypothetical protein n=1 Tax=Paenibacillus thiaminolyticus TaxID=49283 RepID=UPI00232FB210|nr:hypothetical protein [Paenibacillus thiaminolyticus]WCF11725.1 hypothetical protein NDS46_30745 [Paenibacillus thiaminolyticus]